MRRRLLDLLVCPACGEALQLRADDEREGRILEGLLSCGCGERYPIVRSIPRVYRGALEEFGRSGGRQALPPRDTHDQAVVRTRASFGYQWTAFADMTEEFEENFLNYIEPIRPGFFPGKIGLDAGCGFGRHMYYAARYGAEIIGVDYSAAIESSYLNAGHLPNTHFVQADIYHLPFRPATFDFAYSIGVLHHLPDPLEGYRAVHRVVKPSGTLIAWLYSKTRRRMNAALEVVRAVSHRLPYGLLKQICFGAAAVDWAGFIAPYRLASRFPLLRKAIDPFVLDRIKLYAKYPFQVTYADWFDRLSPPIRFYYDEDDLQHWADLVGLLDRRITPTGKYGWRLQGTLPAAKPV
jgi:SAM-dependent methyltransferase